MCGFAPVGQPDPNAIANANPDPPTPADRVVPIHDWDLFITFVRAAHALVRISKDPFASLPNEESETQELKIILHGWQYVLQTPASTLLWCMAITYSKNKDQPSKVANPPGGQLIRKKSFPYPRSRLRICPRSRLIICLRSRLRI